MMNNDAVYFNFCINKSSVSGAGDSVQAIEHLPQGKKVGYFTGTIIREDIPTGT